jgi:branched-chain amino acid aminotransferase
MSPALKYGLSVFEGLRAYWSDADNQLFIFRLQEHTERLFQSMKLLRFEPSFTPEDINDRTVELLRGNNVRGAAHIRTIAYLDGKGEHTVRGPVSYSISALERSRSAQVEKGIRCQVSAWTRISDTSMPPRIKTGGNYVNSRLARYQAKHDGYDDAILLNGTGRVAEAPGACIFLRRRDELITPDVTSGILESITRDTVLQLAREKGIEVTERPVEKTELYAAQEIFLVGSAAEILPVINVDGISIGKGSRGEMTRDLQNAYFDAVIGKNSSNKGWLTSVHRA